MALIDDLVQHIDEPTLRLEIARAVNELRKHRRFGLVFEEHEPEIVTLYGSPVTKGALVQWRLDLSGTLYRVTAIKGKQATFAPNGRHDHEVRAPVADLLVVKRFGEPIYPTLTALGAVRRGGAKPHHAVINGENFHALQLLVYLHEGQVDCIYIDPPYNTGARDWKYNNRYVDVNDTWRHSKWLAFMERRLRLAKRLLKDDGVLIVTIDENEVHHLGMLLERMFPDALRQMVTICINPGGAAGEGLSRVEEYAFFCFLGDARPLPTSDDMLVVGEDADIVHTNAEGVRWEWLMRGGASWYRERRQNLCYPILLNEEGTRIVSAGPPYTGPEGKQPKRIHGLPVAWPVRKDGKLGIWRVDSSRLNWLAERGFAYVSRRDDERGTWTIKYLMTGTIDSIDAGSIEVTGRHPETGRVTVRVSERKGKTAKTMWYRGRHTAGGGGGTQLLNALLGERGLFPFPKSVYAVRDCIDVTIGDRRDALIVDFFAGSGTTFHATCLLNAEDSGQRRSILVTNNDVGEVEAAQLNQNGRYRGDRAYEKRGIFELVARPRCEAVVTGRRPDGKEAEGTHLNGRPLAEGFEENLEFFRLDYLDSDDVALGARFDAILPSLWLAAGGIGERAAPVDDAPWLLTDGVPYAVLFRESRFRGFHRALEKRSELTHVWLVTDSEEAFAELRAALPARLSVSMLYRDYLRNFRINTERSR
jgi:adenine-specific DNA-methyltransferase